MEAMPLLRWLDQLPLTHFAINQLGMRRVINFALSRFPIVRTLPQSGVRYRCSYLDSLALADELFGRKVYHPSISPQLETFADLGCNVGYFTCLLADVNPGRQIKGLMIDANPQVVKEAAWHAQANQLREVYALHGIVGLR